MSSNQNINNLPEWKRRQIIYLKKKLVNESDPNFDRWFNRNEDYEVKHTQRVCEIVCKKYGDLSGVKILDLGCGIGLDTVNLSAAGADVTGVETVEELVEIALLHAKEVGSTASFFEASDSQWQREENYDVVIGIDLLEHDETPENLIMKARKLLKNGGIAIFSTPNRWAIKNILSDPHYHLFGLSLMPRSIASHYAIKLRRLVKEYDVVDLIGLYELRRMFETQKLDVEQDPVREVAKKMKNADSSTQTIKRLALKIMQPLICIEKIRLFFALVYCLFFHQSWWFVISKRSV